MTERRQAPRFEKEAIVFYDILAEDDVILDEGLGKTIDLSAQGIHLALPRSAQPGDRLKLILNLKDQLIQLFATVVWVQPGSELCRVGLIIEHYPSDYTHALEQLFGNQ